MTDARALAVQEHLSTLPMTGIRVEEMRGLIATMAGLLAVVRDNQARQITSDVIPWARWGRDADRCLIHARRILRKKRR